MSEGMSFSIGTLGCKLNQYESECIRQLLEENGWIFRGFDEGADYYIINTCTVTGKTDARCRNMIRRAHRRSPDAAVIATGCYCQTQPDVLERMKEVDRVVDNRNKSRLPSIINEMAGRSEVPANMDEILLERFSGHSRAFIKIQNGCNSSCSYCIIPRARGSSRSTRPDNIIKQVSKLEENGYNEIVLTGIHIGRYGLDLDEDIDLAGLIKMIMDRSDVRIRLSSIEVTEIGGDLIELIKKNRMISSHLHIPLQSGDDGILEKMNRPYSTEYFGNKIMDISSSMENISIGTDVIVGFPGEMDSHFENTYRLLEELPVNYFHVFSYSRRPGTAACHFTGQVKPEIKKRRSKKLRSLSRRKQREFLFSRVGTDEFAVIQGAKRRFSNFSSAITGNYCEVFLMCPPENSGSLLPIRITHLSRGKLYGRVRNR